MITATVVTIGEPRGSWFSGWRVLVLIERPGEVPEKFEAIVPRFACRSEKARHAVSLWWLRYGTEVYLGEVT